MTGIMRSSTKTDDIPAENKLKNRQISYLSVGIEMSAIRCLIVGGGRIAARKAATLLDANASVAILSPTVSDWFSSNIEAGKLRWIKSEYRPKYLADYDFIIAATSNPAINLEIGTEARRGGKLYCVVSSGKHSQVIFPATFKNDNLTVAVHSNGRDCRRSKAVCSEIEAYIGKAAGLGDKEELPQHRPRILFTGLDPENFRTMGTILHWPAVKVFRVEEEYKRLVKIIERLKNNRFGYAIFTSRISVQLFFDGLKNLAYDGRILHSVKIIACGQGTSAVLKENGIIADFVSADKSSKGIVKSNDAQRKTDVLLVQSATAPEALAGALAKELGTVERLCLHRVLPNPELGRELPEHDVVYFTCPCGVRAYWEKYGEQGFKKEVWCLGDITAKQVNEFNIKAKVVQP